MQLNMGQEKKVNKLIQELEKKLNDSKLEEQERFTPATPTDQKQERFKMFTPSGQMQERLKPFTPIEQKQLFTPSAQMQERLQPFTPTEQKQEHFKNVTSTDRMQDCFKHLTPTDQNRDPLKPVTPTQERFKPVTPTPATPAHEIFNPVTPTDQIIGSLWDDINTEMEKYKQSKHYQSDPNLSPRTTFGSCSLREGLSISSYRSQSVKRIGQSDSFTHDSLLVKKRQRADCDLTTEIGTGSKQIDDRTGALIQKIDTHQETILKRLHEAIIVQQDQICQASRALAFCRQNQRFRGSREEIDAQRALLISTERRRALLTERERTLNGTFATENELTGTLTFSAIAFKLSKDYTNKYVQNTSSTSLYYFIVLIKCGENVFHTTLASSDQGIRSGFIEFSAMKPQNCTSTEFSHLISVPGLPPDFSCELEVYSLKVGHDHVGTDRVRGKKGTWRRMVISTPLNAYTNSLSAYPASSAHRPIGVMDPGFQRAGHLTITRHLVQQPKHLLSHLAYPLEGTIVLHLDCHPDSNSLPLREYRSFLSLYELVSGLSSWTRFWCSLDGGQLRFWRYPEDEATKQPCVQLDLSRCVSQVVAVPSSAASFPNSMQVDVVRIDEKTNQREGVRAMLFAADTMEEKEHWMDCINQAIRRSNVWRTVRRK